MATQLQKARAKIIAFFESNESKIFKLKEIKQILSERRSEWELAQRTTFSDFSKELMKNGRLQRLEFPFPHRKEIRYTWGAVPIELVLVSVKPKCHFCHYSAMQMHELTEQQATTVYLNHEQSRRSQPDADMQQGRIDMAFTRSPRMTNNVAKIDGLKVCLLNGMNTGYVGVEERTVTGMISGQSVQIRLTDLERTLIDATVRPFYAGGVAEVLKAFRNASDRLSVNRLAGMLSDINFVYPYHQCVGFYLEQAGTYSASSIERFRDKFNRDFDFYLAYQMKGTRFDKRWRLHVPETLGE
jgi:predicted transcriptional regulator of viral defense system